MNEIIIGDLEKLIEDLRKGVYDCLDINTQYEECLRWQPNAPEDTYTQAGRKTVTITLVGQPEPYKKESEGP